MTLDQHIAEMLAAGGSDALVGFILGLRPHNVALWRRARGVPNLRHRIKHKRTVIRAVDGARGIASLSCPGRLATGFRAGAAVGVQPDGAPLALPL